MKCAVLGGGGFLGSSVVDRLLRDGHSVRILERAQTRPYRSFNADEPVEWLAGDIQNRADVETVVDGAEVVVHLVSTTTPKTSNDDPIHDVRTNVIATLQLLDAMVVRRVGTIVFASSGGTVYGPPKYVPIDEGHPTDPMVSYGITKLAIEKYLLMYERLHGIKANILRLANPYGERQHPQTAQGAVGVFLHQARNGRPIEIWGDGSVVRDFLYVSDAADAFGAAVRYHGAANVFNIGSGIGTSLNELLAALENVLGRPVERRHLPGRPFDAPLSVLDTRLARRELGWEAKIGLGEGLARTVRWLEKSAQP